MPRLHPVLITAWLLGTTISTPLQAAATFYFDDYAGWQSAARAVGIQKVEVFRTTASNLALANEIPGPPTNNQALNYSLTFAAANTNYCRSFTLRALQTTAGGAMTFDDNEGNGTTANFVNAISIGDINNFENDDFQLSFPANEAATYAVSFIIKDNNSNAGEFVNVYGAGDVLIASIPMPAGINVRVGIVADERITAVNFDEDTGGDDIAIADFAFGRADRTDFDGDGMSDCFEVASSFDPTNPDENGNSILDGDEDPDVDGLTNADEELYGTLFFESDSDNDGVSDFDEVNNSLGFSERAIISTSTDGAADVVATDIDTDGDSDLVITSTSGSRVAWYENTDGSFSAEQTISTAVTFPRSVSASDIDNDGDPDVVSVSSGDEKVAWYQNSNGDGSFNSQQLIDTRVAGTAPFAVAAADANGDGNNDIFVANFTADSVVWYENTDGLGNFAALQTITTTPNSPVAIAVGDIDGDNDVDVVSVSQSDDLVAWYENTDGLGTYGALETISNASTAARDVELADINGDGLLDVIVVAFNSDEVIWFENTGTSPRFGAAQVINNAMNGPWTLHAADMDNDNDTDIVVTSAFAQAVYWFENTDSLGSFSTPILIGDSVTSIGTVITTDIDNDGDRDVILAATNSQTLSLYENLSSDPRDSDTDNDGIPDGDEIAAGINPAKADTDDDGIDDAYEINNGLNAANAEDALLDQDNDGSTNLQEYLAGTDVNDNDSDNDTYYDGVEAAFGTDPLDRLVSPASLKVTQLVSGNNSFGMNVAIDGDTAVVTAALTDQAVNKFRGAVYVYTRSGNDWLLQQTITSFTADAGNLGQGVAIDDDTLVITARYLVTNAPANRAFVFTRSGNTWSQQDELVAPDNSDDSFFGSSSIAISDDTVVIGHSRNSTQASSAGAAFVYSRSGSTWSLEDTLLASDGAADRDFGRSVDIDQNTIVVGSNNGAYVFLRVGSGWTEQTKLKHSNAFGLVVAIDGSTIAIGDDDYSSNAGAVYMYKGAAENWTYSQLLTASDGGTNRRFGTKVALDNGTLLSTASGFGSFRGKVYAFNNRYGNWIEESNLLAIDGASFDQFGGWQGDGGELSLSDGIGLIASERDDNENGDMAGAVFFMDVDQDVDNDGMKDLAEQSAGTDFQNSDSDGDGLLDGFEQTYGLDPLTPDDVTLDTDSDGLNYLEEQTQGTLADNPDTDGDGQSDGFEVDNGYDPLEIVSFYIDDTADWENAWQSVGNQQVSITTSTPSWVSTSAEVTGPPTRNTGVGNTLSFADSNNYCRAYTLTTIEPGASFTWDDDEGSGNLATFDNALSIGDIDNYENDDIQISFPLNGSPVYAVSFSLTDTGPEPEESVLVYDRDDNLIAHYIDLPYSADSVDISLISPVAIGRIVFDESPGGDDIAIANFGFDLASSNDSDGDTINDCAEVTAGIDPLDNDTDDDGLFDNFEVDNGFNPLVGGEETIDSDIDGLTNLQEQTAGTNPNIGDSDGDGFSDGEEIALSTDPNDIANAPWGDLNADGDVTVTDLFLANQILLGSLTPTPYQQAALDIAPLNGGIPAGDDTLDVGDILLLNKVILSSINF